MSLSNEDEDKFVQSLSIPYKSSVNKSMWLLPLVLIVLQK